MIRDYFADLELSPDSDLESVKKAYRRLARRFHPDLNPGDPYAQESFRRIQEAYQYLLLDPQRENLRQHLSAFREEREPSRWQNKMEFSFSSPEDFLDEWKIKEERRSEDLDIHLKVEIPRTTWPTRQRIRYARLIVCMTCRGVGGASQSIQMTCKSCAGLSYQMIRRGAFRWKKTCESCQGRGYQVRGACKSCAGRGKTSYQEDIELEVPEEAKQGSPIIYPKLGHESYDKGKKGDLKILWRLQK